MTSIKMNSRLWPVAGMIILLLSIVSILFGGSSSITQSNLESSLKRLAGHVTEEATKSGREGKLNYGKITIDGWGFNKHGIVDSVSLEISEKALLDTHRWSFSTAKLQVLPDAAVANDLIFVFTDPVNIIENSQLKGTVTFSSPLKYGYFDGNDHKRRLVGHTVFLPSQTTVKFAHDAGNSEGNTSGHIIINNDAGPVLHVKIWPEGNEREIDYSLQHFRIIDGDYFMAAAVGLSGNFTQKQGQDGRPEGKYTLIATDLAVRNGEHLGKPYMLNIDIGYKGEPILLKQEKPASGDIELSLNTFLIANNEFKVKADGNITIAVNDPLPSGNINIGIDNVPQFIASDLVPDHARYALTLVLQKITGQPVDSMTHVDVPLKREKNGILYVGNMTFESLVTSVFSDMLHSSPLTSLAPSVQPSAAQTQPQGQEKSPSPSPSAPPPAPPAKNPPAQQGGGANKGAPVPGKDQPNKAKSSM